MNKTFFVLTFLNALLPFSFVTAQEGWGQGSLPPITPEQYVQLRQQNNMQRSQKVAQAALSAPAAASFPAFPNPDLTVLDELVHGLEAQPEAVFQLLQTRFDFTPYYGSSKGPLRTYYDGNGNDLDLALLLAALLERCSGTTEVEIMEGSMDIPIADAAKWLRVQPTAVQGALNAANIPAVTLGDSVSVTRFWVRAKVGVQVVAGEDVGGQVVNLDPAFKGYKWVDGRLSVAELATKSGHTLEGLRSAAAAVVANGTPAGTPGTQLNSLNVANLKTYLNARRDALTGDAFFADRSFSAAELLGRWVLVDGPLDAQPLAASLPFPTTGVESLGAWQSLDDSYKTMIEFIHPEWSTLDGSVIRGLKVPTSDVAGGRLNLKVTGADTVPADVPVAGLWKPALITPSSGEAGEESEWQTGFNGYRVGPEGAKFPPALQLTLPSQYNGVKAAVGESFQFSVAFLNHGPDNLSLTSLSTAGPFTVVGQDSLTVGGQKYRRALIRFTPQDVGFADGTLTLTFQRVIEPTDSFYTPGAYTWYQAQNTPFSVHLRGDGSPPPGHGYHFGAVQVRPSTAPKKTGNCMIYGSSAPFVIQSASITSNSTEFFVEVGGVFPIIGRTVPVGGQAYIPVEFRTANKGQRDGNLRVVAQDAADSSKTWTLDFPLRGYGVDPGSAELTLDGQVIAGGPGALIDDLDQGALTLKLYHPIMRFPAGTAVSSHPYRTLRAGKYAIPLDFGGSEKGGMLAAAGRRMNALQNSTLSAEAKAAEQLLVTLEMMGLSWFQQTNQATRMMEQFFEEKMVWFFRAGIVAQEYKTPVISSANAAGYYIDVANQLVSTFSPVTGADTNDLFETSALMHSAMEHGVLEQMQKGIKAASTVRMIERALVDKKKIHRMNAARLAVVRARTTDKLVGYDDSFLDQCAADLSSSASSWMLLPSDGRVQLIPGAAGAGTSAWKGYGAIKRLNETNLSSIGMLISGGYNGGYAGNQGEASSNQAQQSAAAQQQLNQATPQQPSSTEPINLVTGEYYYDKTDITIGQAAPLGVGFARHYSSATASTPGVLGYGWTHNWESGVDLMTDTGMAFGSRHALDAASAYVAILVLDDLRKAPESVTMPAVTNWTLRALVAGWGVDSVRDNAAKVYVGNKILFYANHANGAGPFYPPPGVTDVLVKLSTVNTYTLTSRDGTVSAFKNVGSGAAARSALSTITNPDGLAITVTYTPGLLVDTVKDTNGRGLNLDYTPAGLLTKITTVLDTAPPRTVTFEYDGLLTTKNLFKVTDPESKFTTHQYADPASHLMTGLQDGMNRTIATNEYDSLGRAIRQKAYGADNMLWSYYFSDLRTVEQDPTGGRTTYYFDEQKRTIGQMDQEENLRRTEYDFNNFPVRVIDAEENEVVTTYDEYLRPRRVDYPDATFSTQDYDTLHRPTVSVSRGGKKTVLEYNSGNTRHRPDRVKVFENENDLNPHSTTHYTYHTTGKQIGHVQAVTDQTGRTVTLDYDSRGAPSKVTRQIEVETANGAQLVAVSTFTTYNARGDLTDTVDERGVRTRMVYNNNRQPNSVTSAFGTTAAYTVTTVYDNAGDAVQSYDSMPVPYRSGQTFSAQGKPLRSYRITQEGTFDSTISGNNYASEQEYDIRDWPSRLSYLAPSQIPWQRVSVTTVPYANGRPFQTTDPLNRTLTYATSAEQTSSSVTDHAGFRMVSSTNVVTRQKMTSDAFDSVGLTDPLTVPADVLRINYAHKPDGELASLTNRRDKTYTMNYTGLGQLQQSQTPGQLSTNRSTSYTYTIDGKVETIIRPDTSTLTMGYYPQSGLLHTQTDPLGTIEHRYDVSGNLTWVRDNATGSTLRTALDGVGRMQTFTDSRGQQTTYTWYANGLLRSVRYHAERQGAVTALATATILDGAVNGITVISGGGYGYTVAPVVTVDPPPGTTGTAATATATIENGIVTGITLTSAGSGYTKAPRVALAPPPPDWVVSYSYYADRTLSKVTDWNGRSTEFDYYQDGKLRTIKRPNGTQRIFTYTLAGELALVAESHPANAANPIIHLVKFAFNNRGQVREKSSFPSEPATATRSGPLNAVLGDYNQLVTVNGVNQEHDLRGNLTKGVLPGGTVGTAADTYLFDPRNRLTAMEGGHSYGYDVGNNRISVTTPSSVPNETTTTQLSVAPLGGLSQVLTETVTGSSTERAYIYTPSGQLLYHVDADMSAGLVSGAATATYYHYDITGSTVALSGEDGMVKARVSYTPYGEITSKDAGVDTRFLFCGAYGVQTDASGLVYMRARYYHPYTCRFLNEDPIGFAGGMNWYAYVSGNPLNMVDPTGLEAIEESERWVGQAGWFPHSSVYVSVPVKDPLTGKVTMGYYRIEYGPTLPFTQMITDNTEALYDAEGWEAAGRWLGQAAMFAADGVVAAGHAVAMVSLGGTTIGEVYITRLQDYVFNELRRDGSFQRVNASQADNVNLVNNVNAHIAGGQWSNMLYNIGLNNSNQFARRAAVNGMQNPPATNAVYIPYTNIDINPFPVKISQ